MLNEKVARLRQLMSEAVPKKPTESAEALALRLFQVHEFNTASPMVVDQTPRGRCEREIDRIATWYGWQAEIVRALDAECVASLQGLSDAGLERLQLRMKQLEECAQNGLDCPDAAPAR
jgi:hypothetical protein